MLVVSIKKSHFDDVISWAQRKHKNKNRTSTFAAWRGVRQPTTTTVVIRSGTHVDFLPLADVAHQSRETQEPDEREQLGESQDAQRPAGVQDLEALTEVLQQASRRTNETCLRNGDRRGRGQSAKFPFDEERSEIEEIFTSYQWLLVYKPPLSGSPVQRWNIFRRLC